jgi:hypothetical protein
MKARDQVEFNLMRNLIWSIALAACMFLGYTEYNTVRDSMLQSMLEDEYAYDYACSQSSQIVKRAEFSRNAYISKTLWVICVDENEERGNFVRPLDVEKKLPKSNPYADMTHVRVLSVLLERNGTIREQEFPLKSRI